MEHGELQLTAGSWQRSEDRGQPPSPDGFGEPRRAVACRQLSVVRGPLRIKQRVRGNNSESRSTTGYWILATYCLIRDVRCEMSDVRQAKLAQLAKQTEGMQTYAFVHLLLEILDHQNSSTSLISILSVWN